MEFASKYGYNYGQQGSDCEEFSDEDTETKQKVKRRIRKADSNVISLRFDRLVSPNAMFACEPFRCQKCAAIMSSLSMLLLSKSTTIWECEFCYENNDLSQRLSAGLDELPKVPDVTYLIDKAPVKAEAPEGLVSLDAGLLTYCIDVSGSMDALIQVNPIEGSAAIEDAEMTRLDGVKAACLENIGHLKSSEPNKRVSLTTFSDQVKFYGDGTGQSSQPLETIGGHDSGDQGLFGQYNTCVPQIQVQTLQPSFVQQQQQVQVQQQQVQVQQQLSVQNLSISDEEETEQEIQRPVEAENLLENKEKLMALAKNLDVELKPIRESSSNLEHRIKHLQTEGSTALGPGLVFCVGFSSKQPGSQVILCTDGCANVGMGSVEYGDPKVAEKFYEDLADEAKDSGVTVNVISMEGTDCKLALLGKVADRSNGTLSIVNPAKLGEQFKSILENRVVATNVSVKLIVNSKYLYIRDEELEVAEGKAIEKNDLAAKEALEATKKSVLEKSIGNATIDTEITFEYGVRRKLADGASEQFKELPFQLQITYTTLDGAKAMRVYTKVQEFTKDRKEAEQNVLSQDLLFANSAQKMSHLVESNNVYMAKFRSKQMEQQQLANAWDAPSGYQRAQMVVGKLSKSTRMEDLGDEDAEQIYSSKKVSRNKVKK